MVFLGIYRAAYAYAPQSDQELALDEGDLLFVLEKSSEDDWWKAKKKATSDEEDVEPEGLIPNNYVEEAKALYDYTRQTDEELSFKEEDILTVYDTTDPDWTLVSINGEYGFAPANYIEMTGTAARAERPATPVEMSDEEPTPTESPPANPAAALASIIQKQGKSPSSAKAHFPEGKPTRQPTYTPEASEDESPPMPARRQVSSPPRRVVSPPRAASPEPEKPQRGRYHLYNVNEMVSALGKQKKLPTILGINTSSGTITLSAGKPHDAPQQEWTADKLTHYSLEGKHVFIELIKPSRSVDLHAGAKDTAEEIVSALGELHGAVRAEGLKEVLAISGNGPKKGRVLYEFEAQGSDEVSVKEGDEVVILNDRESEDWWQVRRVKNGKEGVVPSSYIDVVDSAPKGITPGLSSVEQNRLEEERLTKEAVESAKKRERAADIAPPQRGSSLADKNGKKDKEKDKKPKPDMTKLRTWTDRSGSFKVEAEFLGCRDGKIHLHKTNGVKIAVPVSKMSTSDLEYVERKTGMSLDEDKPLSDLKKKQQMRAGATITNKDEYDWFDFFLTCGVDVHSCQRYANNFSKDSMDESVLSDISANTLRSLGLKEGDILRVMRYLDTKFGRAPSKSRKNVSFAGGEEDDANGSAGGLFSGPGGALRNNTRKGRPAPTVQTSDVVDAKAFLQSPDSAKPASVAATSSNKEENKFEDDAWSVKPAKTEAPAAVPAPVAAPAAAPAPAPAPAPAAPPPSESLRDLTLLQAPLTPAAPSPPAQPAAAPPAQAAQQTGATPSMFAQIAALNTGDAQPRQRPTAPLPTGMPGSLMPPPPARPLSAPQNTQASQFAPPPLVQQLTGYQPQNVPVQSQLQNQGTSLNDISAQNIRNQMLARQMLQPQMTGYMPQQQTGFMPNMQYPGQLQPQMTGYQQMLSSQPTGSPFANPPIQPFQPQQTGSINNFLPPALVPQQTGMMQPQQTGMLQPQQTGMMQPQMTGMQNFNQMPMNVPPVPPIPQQHSIAPLVPQRTGPAPPVRFGVAKKLAPQPTGRRANLSHATPENPFGFD